MSDQLITALDHNYKVVHNQKGRPVPIDGVEETLAVNSPGHQGIGCGHLNYSGPCLIING